MKWKIKDQKSTGNENGKELENNYRKGLEMISKEIQKEAE